jgi:hypothetical protein
MRRTSFIFLLSITRAILPKGSAFGKAALEKVLGLPMQILPFVSRVERMRHARKFSRLRDASDADRELFLEIFPQIGSSTAICHVSPRGRHFPKPK